MNILVTGGKGQLGSELRSCFETMTAEIGPIDQRYSGARVKYVDYDSLDISDELAVKSWFFENGPYDLVVNCAAITNVDGCENNEANAYRVNAHGAEYLATACEVCGAKFVHVSTDYVFPGNDERSRTESDITCPLSAYGRSKWAGEILSLAACERTYVVRTAWLYGYVGKNFVKTMMSLAREKGSISVVSDQYGNPTSANDLAYEILKIALTDNYGTYHCTNNGTCSWFDFACAVVDGAGIPCEKVALTSAGYKELFPHSAERPTYSSLENRHLSATIGDEMRSWRDALLSYLEKLKSVEVSN